jgi:hypothetical protein
MRRNSGRPPPKLFPEWATTATSAMSSPFLVRGVVGGPPCGAHYFRRWCGVHARYYLVNGSANPAFVPFEVALRRHKCSGRLKGPVE